MKRIKNYFILIGLVFLWQCGNPAPQSPYQHILELVGQEKWDEAARSLNQEIPPTGFSKQYPSPFPQYLSEDHPIYSEFMAKGFSVEDMRYLWRMMQMDSIANQHAITKEPQKRAALLLDFVYRNVQFGVSDDQYIRTNPLDTLLVGKGLCEQLSWVFHQLLRSSGVPCARLLLFEDGPESPSPHTLSLVQLDGRWIPMDASFGMILQNANTGKPASLPQNFMIDANQESVTQFGNRAKPMQPFIQQVQAYGPYRQLAPYFKDAIPVFDEEWYAHTDRFLWLQEQLKPNMNLPGLAAPFRTVHKAVVNELDHVLGWFTRFPDQLYTFTTQEQMQIRERYEQIYKHLMPLRSARLAMLKGDYAYAQKQLEQAPLEAAEDAQYYLAVVLFEMGQYDQATDRFKWHIQEYPQSNWKPKCAYHLALIAKKSGVMDEDNHWIAEAEQDHEASLFYWMIELGLL